MRTHHIRRYLPPCDHVEQYIGDIVGKFAPIEEACCTRRVIAQDIWKELFGDLLRLLVGATQFDQDCHKFAQEELSVLIWLCLIEQVLVLPCIEEDIHHRKAQACHLE
jgi:hypothetical protein